MKRLFDVLSAALGLILLSPVFLLVALWVRIDSRGSIFFRQPRVGRFNRNFDLLKFRSMAHQEWTDDQLITVGDRDPRVTRAGFYLRRYKLDELPQLINVLKGDMSIVGPRPLVRQQVEIYPEAYRKVLVVRPGITCRASLVFCNEDELLGRVENPEVFFAEALMPVKIRLNTDYVNHHSLVGDLGILIETLIPSLRKPVKEVLSVQEYEQIYGSTTH